MYFHEAIGHALVSQGVTTVFGLIGDGNLFMMDAFQRLAGGHYYSVANEAAAVLAANGYARTSGRLGAATVTHGPALTNTVTALTESVRGRTPLLLVAGDTPIVDRENLQNICQRDVVLGTGAAFEQVRAPETVEEDLARAIRTAVLDRRPVVLNVPAEFQWREVEPPSKVAPKYIRAQPVRPAAEALDRAVGIVATSRRPIVLAGGGASDPPARDALLRLAKRIGAPVATTLRGKDLFRGHPHDLGIFGTLSHHVATDVIGSADTVLAFGAALNRFTAAEGSLLAGKAVVHVDIDRHPLNQWADADAAVLGDVVAVADAIVQLLDEAGIPASGFATPELAARLAQRARVPAKDYSGAEGTVDLDTALMRLDEAFPQNRTLVTDAGRFVVRAFSLLHVPEPSADVYTVNFGSIGLGMGNAIGAAVGAPQRPVLMVCGDGGFMLGGLAEFNTAVRHGLDVVVVVLNDGAYGAEHVQFRDRGMDPSSSMFGWPEFAPVAEALGGRGYTVRNLHDLDLALKAVQERDRPTLIDVKLDPDQLSSRPH